MASLNFTQCYIFILFKIVFMFILMDVAFSSEIHIIDTSSEKEVYKIINIFQKEFPNIDVSVSTLSSTVYKSGVWTDVLRSSNIKGDILWGLPTSILKILWKSGQLDNQIGQYTKLSEPWIPTSLSTSALCVNMELLNKNNIPNPRYWEDLSKPVYREQILMPNPEYDFSSISIIAKWISIFGGYQEAWRYMDALYNNIIEYPMSSEKVCNRVAEGKATIGISSIGSVMSIQSKVKSINLIIPKEGLATFLTGMAVVRDARHLQEANTFAEWWWKTDMLRELYKKINSDILFIDISEEQISTILPEWTFRYDSKAE